MLEVLKCCSKYKSNEEPRPTAFDKYSLSSLGPLERVQGINQVLMFTMQLCVVLHEANGHSAAGSPESCSMWVFALVAFVHKPSGVATAKVTMSILARGIPTRRCSCLNLPCVHPLTETARERASVQFCLKDLCSLGGEKGLLSLPTSPCPPK